MKILVVEDNASLGESLEHALRAMDHSVDVVTDGLMASSVLATEQYDLVTLDLCLPGLDGLEVLERFRTGNRDTPVLILTIRGRLIERVRGLGLGADDYMTKPFEIAEFEARVRCLLRRRDGLRTNVIEFGPLSFNTAERTVVLDDEAVDLTRRERSLLEILLFCGGYRGRAPRRPRCWTASRWRSGARRPRPGRRLLRLADGRPDRRIDPDAVRAHRPALSSWRSDPPICSCSPSWA